MCGEKMENGNKRLVGREGKAKKKKNEHREPGGGGRKWNNITDRESRGIRHLNMVTRVAPAGGKEEPIAG